MPKIIENLETRLMEEAKKQIEENGYGNVTIRSVAKACGVGIGTVYNYFPSKDNLLATYMLSDWNACIDVITDVSAKASTPEPVVQCICQQLCSYAENHRSVIQDENAAVNFRGAFSHYHVLLRSQLSEPLKKFCRNSFAAEFIAEALLTWSMTERSFHEIWEMIQNCF